MCCFDVNKECPITDVERDSQSGQHVTWANDIDTDTSMGPLDRQTGCQVANGGFGCVIRGLRLGDVDDGARHGPNHHDTTRGLPLHQVTSNSGSEQIRSIHIDAPELLHTVEGVGNRIEILGEAGRSDQMVNLAVILDDFLNRRVD